MRICAWCQEAFAKRPSESYEQYAKRLCCSRACSGKLRMPRGVPRVNRYRQISVDGRKYLEHRYVMQESLGRQLLPIEHVHHINGDRLDNRLENLELVTVSEHAERHTWRPVTKACVICGQSFTPHKTKRARAQTCGPECKSQLLSLRNAQRKAA